MRRALALAAIVSARQDHACAEDVCFYHIPKTGGDSFKYFAGCIPVIFSLQNELVAPWFVPRGVAVRLSERKYGNGTFKALDVLRRIPSEEIKRRQSIIRKHGHRLQYAVDDLGEEPDAVETLFVGALGLAHDLAALYQV